MDVVARDKHGNPVRDLTEKDFQVFEHLDWIRRVPQKIASFQAVNISGVSTPEPKEAVRVPAGVYTNRAAAGEIHVRPVILLIDEVNTYLFMYPGKMQKIKAEYNRLYPKGRIDLWCRILQIAMFVFLALTAIAGGFLKSVFK